MKSLQISTEAFQTNRAAKPYRFTSKPVVERYPIKETRSPLSEDLLFLDLPAWLWYRIGHAIHRGVKF
ncbi:MAG: hypothetical protein ACM3PY_08685 [Omnitrophica WOR_2 bacterium]